MDNGLPVRLAVLEDLPRIVEIYNQAIQAGNVTGDFLPFTVQTRLDWFNQHDRDRYPVYVAAVPGGKVSGYACLSPYRNRAAMQRTAEVSYYVDQDFQGRGIGSSLLNYVLTDCGRLSKQILLAVVLEWNTASIRLLQKYGFKKWGYLPEIADFSGRLCGHEYYGRRVKKEPVQNK